MAHHHLSPELKAAIDLCLLCHQTGLTELSHHCLPEGGPHLEPEHVRLMLSCAEICRACAAIRMIGSRVHQPVAGACAMLCEACAESCRGIEGMEDCADLCRRCAESCAAMAA